MQNKPHSYHAFLFPFKWELLLDGVNNFGERCDLDALHKNLGFLDEKPSEEPLKWYRKPFAIDNQLAYNEYNYFYDFVRDVIYDKGDKTEKKNEFSLKSLVRHYEFSIPKDESYFHIRFKENCRIQGYKLLIRKIQLDIYETGVGVLSYHLQNFDYPKPEDILNINQFGRRIFVGGFYLPSNYLDARKELNIEEVKFVDLADELELSFGNKAQPITEDFKACKDFKNFEKAPFFLPSIITELLTFNKKNPNIITTEWSYDTQDAKLWIAPSIDDRMCVHSWYRCDVGQFSKNVGVKFKRIYKPKNDAGFYECDFSDYVESSNFWYKYIYIDHDNGFSVANNSFKNNTINNATYDRWLDFGTLYGITKYSFTMFCIPTPDFAPTDFLLSIHETMYLKMVELSLVQRATVLRFSDEVQYVSSIKDESKKTELIRSLYDYHIRFVNKIDFREVTPQEQGIELYDMMQQAMRIDKQVEYLDKEINELHDYALLLEEKRRGEENEKRQIIEKENNKIRQKEAEKRENEELERNKKLALITYVGIPITFLSLIISIWGLLKDVNVTSEEIKGKDIEQFGLNMFWNTWLFEFVAFLLMFYSGKKIFDNWTNSTNRLWIVLFFIAFLIAIVLPFPKIF